MASSVSSLVAGIAIRDKARASAAANVDVVNVSDFMARPPEKFCKETTRHGAGRIQKSPGWPIRPVDMDCPTGQFDGRLLY